MVKLTRVISNFIQNSSLAKMLSYSDGSEGKSKDSKIAKSSSVDLPIIPFKIMTSEYNSQLEALMMEKFNKAARERNFWRWHKDL